MAHETNIRINSVSLNFWSREMLSSTLSLDVWLREMLSSSLSLSLSICLVKRNVVFYSLSLARCLVKRNVVFYSLDVWSREMLSSTLSLSRASTNPSPHSFCHLFFPLVFYSPPLLLYNLLNMSELFSLDSELQRKNVIHIRSQQSTTCEWLCFGLFKGASLETLSCFTTLAMVPGREITLETKWMDMMKPYARWTLKHRE